MSTINRGRTSSSVEPWENFLYEVQDGPQAGRTRRDQGADTGRSAGAPRPGPPYRGPSPAQTHIPEALIVSHERASGSLAPVRAGPSTADQASPADHPSSPQTFVG